MIDMEQLKFDEKGLIPAIVVDAEERPGAHPGLYEQGEPGNLHQGGAHLLLEPLPPGAVAEGGDLRQRPAHHRHHRRLRL